MSVVRNYTSHGIQVDVLVIDWKHYRCVGDWSFTLNPDVCWHTPDQMVQTLKQLGVSQVFVSLHPWSQPGSLTYDNMTANHLCITTADGETRPWAGWTLPTCASPDDAAPAGANCLYDPSNALSREFLWDNLKTGYWDYGTSLASCVQYDSARSEK